LKERIGYLQNLVISSGAPWVAEAFSTVPTSSRHGADAAGADRLTFGNAPSSRFLHFNEVSIMQFSEILKSMRLSEGIWRTTTTEDWLQGRSLFGGLQAAIAQKAMRGLVPKEIPLRSLQVTFLSPVPAGEVRVRAQVLRAGRNTTHVEARLLDGDQVVCLVVGIFGAARQSAVRIVPQQPAVDSTKPLSFTFVPGLTPSFTQHFALRWLRGGMPFSGSRLPENVIEIDMRDAGKASEGHVIAFADVIPPVALSMLETPAPGSSMTWMLEMMNDRVHELPLRGWRMDAEVTAAADGYTSQTGSLWGPGGALVALSRQSMVVFA
jgi:acyl-CoA thioesterase